MPPQNGDLLFPGVTLSCLLHAFSVILKAERPLHFQLGRNTITLNRLEKLSQTILRQQAKLAQSQRQD
jgi:hypothetical protein